FERARGHAQLIAGLVAVVDRLAVIKAAVVVRHGEKCSENAHERWPRGHPESSARISEPPAIRKSGMVGHVAARPANVLPRDDEVISKSAEPVLQLVEGAANSLPVRDLPLVRGCIVRAMLLKCGPYREIPR